MPRTTADDRWTFFLITPDGIAAGAFDEIVARLRAHRLTIAACRLIELRVPVMRRIYPGSGLSWPMLGRLYRLAPACLLLLTSPRGGSPALALQAKGHVHPERADPGTVRAIGENALFNFSHCPDDARAAHRELAWLVGRNQASQLISASLSGDRRLNTLTGAEAVRRALPAPTGTDAMSFTAVANRICRRLVQHLAVALHQDAKAIELLVTAQATLDRESNLFLSFTSRKDRLRIGQSIMFGFGGALSSAARRLDDRRIHRGLDALAELFALGTLKVPADVLAMSRSGVYLSPLERIVVECQAATFVTSDDLRSIYPEFSSPL